MHASLAIPRWLPAGSPTYLVQLPAAAEPEEPAHGLGVIRGSDRVLATASDHSPRDARSGPMRVTSGKSRVRGKPPARICEGKAEWPSYSAAARRQEPAEGRHRPASARSHAAWSTG